MFHDRSDDNAPSEERIAEIVRNELGCDLQGVEMLPDGSSAVCLLELGGQATPDQAVLKYCLSDSYGRFAIESHLLEFVDRHTSVPVPAVYGAGFDEAPYTLMEYCPGMDVNVDLGPFPPEIQRRLAEEAGSYLAQINASRTFENHGVLTAVDGRVVPDEPFETATDFFLDYLGKLWDGFPSAFDDLDLREPVEAATRELPAMTPVLTHNDYSVRNLSIDPGEYTTNAILDWGSAMAAPAAFELAKAEAVLCLYGPLDSPMRRRVREGLLSGYGSVPEGYAEWRDTLLLINRVGAMRMVVAWFEDEPEEMRDRMIEVHREAVQKLL